MSRETTYLLRDISQHKELLVPAGDWFLLRELMLFLGKL